MLVFLIYEITISVMCDAPWVWTKRTESRLTDSASPDVTSVRSVCWHWRETKFPLPKCSLYQACVGMRSQC